MKLVMLASGRSFHATRWANALVERGIETFFISIHPLERKLDKRVTFIQIGNGKKSDYIFHSLKLRKILKSIAPDLVHSHYASGYGILGFLSGRSYLRVTSLYGAEVYDFPYKSILHKKLLELVCSTSDKVLSTSNAMAKEYKSIYPNLPKPIITPFGVDIDKFKSKITLKENNEIHLGLVKKLEYKYGIDILIKALGILVNEYKVPNVSLSVVGGGSQKKSLEALILSEGLTNHVSLLGWLDNDQIPNYLDELDIVVIPSRFDSESFGVSAVESLSMGIPTIVSNVGGLPEVVEHGVSGIVIEKEDPALLAETILYLINDEEKLSKFKKNSRKRVIDLFNWNENVSQVIDIYEDMLSFKGNN
ncbi:glycosyltransferase family 4 protein [Vibrio celticus]|uniref:glycosyltransferase family 4 protein n=1 Tax=Vibrio celticus TaxID=446372 RepID=UPI0040680D78